jgi:bifunctional DNA-binding transcriptional regulator/antitoxin component of YhaV-PrlF toxin-antitoxin module
MTTLKVTEWGEVTFRKEVLEHLGIRPGEKIELRLLSNGRGLLEASRPAGPTGSMNDLIGLLKGRREKTATLDR